MSLSGDVREKLIVLAALFFGLFIVGQNLWQMDWALERFDSYYRPLAIRDLPDSAPGAGKPRARDVPKLFWDDDSYMHLSLLREMHASGAMRQAHWTHVDNSPNGRNVYWSSLYLSWVRILAELRGRLTGTDFLSSLEPAAAWANPVLHALLLALLAAFLPRQIGPVLTSLVLLAAAATPRLLISDLKPFNVDHQGLHFLTFLGALMLLVLGGCGWVSSAERSTARVRNCFMLSGVFVGIGAWVGVVRQDAAWLVATVGILSMILLSSPDTGKITWRYDPRLWRLWGTTAAVVSLIGFLLEYFPGNLERSRLEVNNPLQALSLYCAGWLLSWLAELRHGNAFRWSLRSGGRVLCAGLGVCLLPIVILLAPPGWVAMRDPGFIQVLAPVGEMVSPLTRFGARAVFMMANEQGLMMLCLPLAMIPFALFGRLLPPNLRAAILLTAPSLILFSLLFLFHQPTWGYFQAAASLAHLLAALLAVRHLTQYIGRRALIRAVCLVVLLAQLGYNIDGVTSESRAIRLGKNNPPELLEAARFREIAFNLSLLDPEYPPVFMSPAALGPKLAYFGRAATIGSQYENLPGIAATLDFFSDAGDLEVARALAGTRRITYVIVVPGQLFIDTSVRIPKERLAGAAGLTLGERLSLPKPEIPEWLELIPWPSLFPAIRSSILIFRVVN